MQGNPVMAIAKRLAKRSLKTQMTFLVMLTAFFCAVVVGLFTYQRSMAEARTEATHWARSLAQVAAQEGAAHGPAQHGQLANAIQAIVQLEHVQSVTLVSPDQAEFLHVGKDAQGSPQLMPSADEAVGIPSESVVFSGSSAQVFVPMAAKTAASNSSSLYATAEANGWVQLRYNATPHIEDARKQWAMAMGLSLVLVAVTVWLLLKFLQRTLDPIASLIQFSSNLVHKPGEQVRMHWGSADVRALGYALNSTSSELASQAADLQQKLARLRNILATAADAIIGVDADGHIRSANPAAERMFGHPANEMKGTKLDCYLPGLDANQLKVVMEQGMFIQSTQSHLGSTEQNAIRHGGTEFPVEVSLGEITDDPEVRYTCIVRDLSESKLTEEYMALYGRAVDCTLNGIVITDARRYPQPIVYVNPGFSRITEFAPHEVLGRDLSQLNGSETDTGDLGLLERTVKEGGELTVTLKQYRKSGTVFHNKLSVSPVRGADDQITHYIHVLEDVSSQIEVKRRLIERTARLNATFDLSPDGFAVFDAHGDLISSNPALRSMLGELPPNCSIGAFDGWVLGLCEDEAKYRTTAEALKDPHKDLIEVGRPSPKVLEREIRKNLGGSGETILYFRDVTHQMEVDRIKSEFLATAAHELRTPLASILGFTELMIHRKYSDEKRIDLLQTVHRQGTLLSNLIQELLDLSRIEARQGKDFHIAPTPLSELVAHAVESVKDAKHGRKVHIASFPDDIGVMADPSKIEQCLINLLSNAFKYSPDGGEVHLTVQTEQSKDEEMVVVRISDQGIGLTPTQLSRVFERFYRADASGNIPGTGLGLNLVKEIAEIHGGSVVLESEPGVGTTAILRLRRAELPILIA
ncbi:PAS domain S-box protein [Hydrogenophaga sp. 5NK40-0174]|uniref:PAS domain-containing sensor histidine kinase n=1 Tax=Hydrogenophaga sp. 5NK40-0174 TaxID=3127649 RepID=UPI0031025F07